MFNKKILLIGTVLLIAFLLSSSVIAEKPYEGIELNMVIIDEPESYAADKLTDKFYEETGIRVNIDILGSAAMGEKIRLESAARTGAIDIFRVGPAGSTVDYLDAGWIEPIDPYFEKFGFWEEIEDYPESVIDYFGRYDFTEGDHIWAIPVNANVQLFAYREDIFEDPTEKEAFKEKYGYELRPPETYQETLDAAEFFTRDTNGDGNINQWGILERLQMTWAMQHIAHKIAYSTGHSILDEELNVAFENEDVIEGLKWFKELTKYFPPYASPGDYNEIERGWAAGEYVMLPIWVGTVRNLMDPELNPDYYNKTSVKLLPRNEKSNFESGKSLIGGGAYAIHSHSENPEAAARFITWLMSEENIDEYIEAGGNPPRNAFFENESVLESPIWSKILPVWLEALEKTAEPRIGHPDVNVSAVQEELAIMINNIIFEDAEPSVIVKNTADRIDNLIK